MDVLSTLSDLFASVSDLVTDSPWTYLLVLGVTALDVLFPLLPAETVVVIAAILAGTGSLNIGAIVVAAATGAFLGDNVGYWIGRLAGPPVVSRVLRGHTERLAAVKAEFAERGGSFIIVGRFVPGGRTVVAIGSGVLHMPWRRFVLYDAAAAVIWALQASIPAYLGGLIFHDQPWLALLVGIGISLVVAVITEAIRRRRSRGPAPAAAPDP